jgi:5'-3' exonuclease
MGIKFFQKFIREHFSSDTTCLRKDETVDRPIDTLMVDMNGVYHDAAQKIYRYGRYKDYNNKKQKDKHSEGKLRKLMFIDVCRTIDRLLVVTTPSKLILCADGPAPCAKQSQQRSRRFKSSRESTGCSFDSCCLTPGTQFMDFLSKYIDWHIRKSLTHNKVWQDLEEIVFSNEKVPGEGEHRLMNYVRIYGNDSDSFCIHGLDADLIMLGLASHKKQFYILRDELYDYRYKYKVLNVGSGIRPRLLKMLRFNNVMSDEEIVNDFVFLAFLIGNDFLPHIPSIEIFNQGMNLLLDVYKSVCSTHGSLTMKSDSGDICFRRPCLKQFLEELGSFEQSNFENKLLLKDELFPDLMLDNHSMYEEGHYKVDIEAYMNSYNIEKFGASSSSDMGAVCHEYFKGLDWVLKYYTKGVPDWNWIYRNHYSPAASVLAQHIDTYCSSQGEDKQEEYPYTKPLLPFQQLLCVLPPTSAKLIPSPLCDVLLTGPMAELCDMNFQVDLAGKLKEWEGIPLIDFMDFELMNIEYLKKVNNVPKNELRRNMKGNSFRYKYDSTGSKRFVSYYGDINDCKCYTEQIYI